MDWNTEIKAAQQRAVADAAPFVPSMQQIEDALQPMTDRLVAMPWHEACEIFRQAAKDSPTGLKGTWGAIVLQLFKAQVTNGG